MTQRTYCVVQNDGTNYVLSAINVFEVAHEFGQHECALQSAISHNRPLSLRLSWGAWTSRNLGRLPVMIAGSKFIRIRRIITD